MTTLTATAVTGWRGINFHSDAEQNPICFLSLFLTIMKANDAIGSGHLHHRLSLFTLVKLWREKKSHKAVWNNRTQLNGLQRN